MNTIRQRFLQAWDDFLLVLHLNDEQLSAFAERWQILCSDWESCLHEADHETRELAGEVAGKIEGLTSDFYLFESRALSLKDDLLDSLEDVFASLTLEEKPVAQLDPVSGAATVITALSGEHDVISPAQWLLRNLHNPYPPSHVRFSKGRSANCKDVKDWFSKARQRIGWTRLLRDRFAGCRSVTTDAAFRALVRDDPNNPLDNDLKTAFLAIQSHAKLVYGDKSVVPPSSPRRSRSISPTPSLTFSCSSEETGDELCPTSPPEDKFRRPPKRASSDSSKCPSLKRRRIESQTSPPLPPVGGASPYTGTPTLRSRKRHLPESDSDNSQPKRPREVKDVRLHVVPDPLLTPAEPEWPNLNKTFQIPNLASTNPPHPTSFYLDFFNSESVSSTDVTLPVDPLTAWFEIPQLDLLQPSLPSFDSDWSEFLNFEPDFPRPKHSPSLASSLAGTPPLTDDVTLSPSSLPDSGFSSPDHFYNILPHLSNKSAQFPPVVDPMIQGQDFLLPPGDDAGFLSTNLFSMH